MIKLNLDDISKTPAPQPLFSPVTEPLAKEKLPVAVYEDDPALIELWHDAWRIGWKHVYQSQAMPFSPYLGEGCGTNKVWIWDSCFMTLWGCYANALYPVANTLDNLYAIISGTECEIKIHHPDNPPLFGWAELVLYQHTGNRERIEKLIRSGVLQDYYFWRENEAAPGDHPSWGGHPVLLRKIDRGYLWSGNPSGMDNTPRGRGNYQYLLWVDALAQQGLFAKNIAELCEIAGDTQQAQKFYAEYEEKRVLMQNYFDPEDGCFYDLVLTSPDRKVFSKVLTPASFWPLLAGMATAEQAEAMAEKLLDPSKLGGPVACPGVSRDDPDFDPRGGYWRGGVWLPVFYMTMKALDSVGKYDLARKLSLQLLHWMKDCYDRVEPHSIWECYSPTGPLPSSSKQKPYCRLDFCGWSALAPISLLLEDVIGLRSVNAADMTAVWYPPETNGKCGVKNLRLGDGTVSFTAQNGTADIETDCDLTLELCGKRFTLAPGKHQLEICR